MFSNRFRILENFLIFINLDGRECGGAGKRVTVIGQASREHVTIKEVGNLLTDDHCAKRNVTGGNSLRGRDDVGRDIPIIHGKPFAGASPSAHDFVGDQEDSVLVANLAHTGPILIGRDDESVRAGHTFENDGGDLVWTFVLDHLFDMADTFAMTGILRPAERTAVAIRVKEMDNTRNRRLSGQAAIITGERDRAVSRAVIGAIASEDFMSSRELTRDLDRVLIRFRAA